MVYFCTSDNFKLKETKKTKNPKTLTVSLEIYSFCALVEEAFVSVEFFFEEMAVFLGLAAF